MTNLTEEPNWIGLATSRTVVYRAIGCTLVVGTVLAIINHGDCIATGHFGPSCWLKSGLTALVPFVVSTVSSVHAIRCQARCQRLSDSG